MTDGKHYLYDINKIIEVKPNEKEGNSENFSAISDANLHLINEKHTGLGVQSHDINSESTAPTFSSAMSDTSLNNQVQGLTDLKPSNSDIFYNLSIENNYNNIKENLNENSNNKFATIAPYFEEKVNKNSYDKLVKKSENNFFKFAKNLGKLLNVKVNNYTNNISGYTYKNGKDTTEISYTFNFNNSVDNDTIDLFACLMCDLAYEQQESVFGANYLKEAEKENANALEVDIYVKDVNNVDELLRENDVHYFTIDLDNKVIKVLNFELDFQASEKFSNKIDVFIAKLGGNYVRQKTNYVFSRYFDKDARREAYKTWLTSNRERFSNRELRLYTIEAYEKVGGNISDLNIDYERTNDFRRIQEESRREFNTRTQHERSTKFKNDESLRKRLSRVLRKEVNNWASNIFNASRVLDNTYNFSIYDNVDGNLFHDVFEIARTYLENGELVDLHDNYNNCICYLSDDGLSGFAIEENGNLVSVFNINYSKRGFLRSISQIVKEKSTHLDCYKLNNNHNLTWLYENYFGFKTASIMDYNMEYDHDDIAKNHNMPQVAFMVNTNEEVITKHFNKNQYDDAVKYQQSYLNKDKYSLNLNEQEINRKNRKNSKRLFDSVKNIKKQFPLINLNNIAIYNDNGNVKLIVKGERNDIYQSYDYLSVDNTPIIFNVEANNTFLKHGISFIGFNKVKGKDGRILYLDFKGKEINIDDILEDAKTISRRYITKPSNEPINQSKKVNVFEKEKLSSAKDLFENLRINMTDNMAGVVNAGKELGMSREEIESYTYQLRSASNATKNQIIKGDIKYDLYGNAILNDVAENELTNPLSKTTEIIENLLKKFNNFNLKDKLKNNSTLKKLSARLHINFKDGIYEVREDLIRTFSCYLYNKHAIDSNNAALKIFQKAINDLDLSFFNNLGLISKKELFNNTFDLINDLDRFNEKVFTKSEIFKALQEDSKYILSLIKGESNTTLTKLEKNILSLIDAYEIKSVYGKSVDKNTFNKSEFLKDLKLYFEKDLFNSELEKINLIKGSEIDEYLFDDFINALEEKTSDSEILKSKEYKKTIKNFKDIFVEPSNNRLNKANLLIEETFKDDLSSLKEFEAIIRENIDNTVNKSIAFGLNDSELVSYWRELYPNYVPLNREKVIFNGTNSKGNLDARKLFKERTGSNLVIKPLYENVASLMNKINNQHAKNELLRSLYNASLKNNKNSSKIIFNQEENNIPRIENIDDLMKVDEEYNENKIVFYANKNKDVMVANVDDNFLNAFKTIDKYSYSGLNNLFSTIKIKNLGNTFAKLVTIMNPFFIGRNAARDFQDAMLTTKNNPIIFVKELAKSYIEIFSGKSELWNLYLTNGGMSSGFNTNFASEDTYKMLVDTNKKKGVNVLKWIEFINQVVEQATRFTEFKLSYKKYLGESKLTSKEAIRTALFDSANITTDFSRHGELSKALNGTLIPFLNAQIQGACKLVNFVIKPRNLKEISLLIIKLIILGLLPELFNELFLSNNEDYQTLPDYTKEQYWLIPIGNANFIKIPKGRILGSVNSFFNNAIDAIKKDKNILEASKQVLETSISNLSPIDFGKGIRTIFSPINDVRTNTTWYGGKIDNQSDLNKLPSERYNQSTSYISRLIGNIFNCSPKKVEYLLEQYTGVVGDIILPTTSEESFANPLLSLRNFINSNTTVDSVKNNKYRSEFYNYRQELLYSKNMDNKIASYQYNYLNKALKDIDLLEKKILTAKSEEEKYTIYLIIREAYKSAINNAKLLGEKLENIDLSSDDRFIITEAYRQALGSEEALKYYNNSVYKNALEAKEFGVNYDDFYVAYFEIRSLNSKQEAYNIAYKITKNQFKAYALLKLLNVRLSKDEELKANKILKK